MSLPFPLPRPLLFPNFPATPLAGADLRAEVIEDGGGSFVPSAKETLFRLAVLSSVGGALNFPTSPPCRPSSCLTRGYPALVEAVADFVATVGTWARTL